jgi:hypothetical protein
MPNINGTKITTNFCNFIIYCDEIRNAELTKFLLLDKKSQRDLASYLDYYYDDDSDLYDFIRGLTKLQVKLQQNLRFNYSPRELTLEAKFGLENSINLLTQTIQILVLYV